MVLDLLKVTSININSCFISILIVQQTTISDVAHWSVEIVVEVFNFGTVNMGHFCKPTLITRAM